MVTDPTILDRVGVASPCKASWDAMTGNNKVRFCAQCKLNVYNLSGMNQSEAEALVQGKESRLCVRFFRREDGTMLTQNCPVGLAALKKKLAWVAGGFAAVVTLVVGGLGGFLGRGSGGGGASPLRPTIRPTPPPPSHAVMGDMIAPPPACPPTTPPPGATGTGLEPAPAAPPPRELMGKVQMSPEEKQPR